MGNQSGGQLMFWTGAGCGLNIGGWIKPRIWTRRRRAGAGALGRSFVGTAPWRRLKPPISHQLWGAVLAGPTIFHADRRPTSPYMTLGQTLFDCKVAKVNKDYHNIVGSCSNLVAAISSDPKREFLASLVAEVKGEVEGLKAELGEFGADAFY